MRADEWTTPTVAGASGAIDRPRGTFFSLAHRERVDHCSRRAREVRIGSGFFFAQLRYSLAAIHGSSSPSMRARGSAPAAGRLRIRSPRPARERDARRACTARRSTRRGRVGCGATSASRRRALRARAMASRARGSLPAQATREVFARRRTARRGRSTSTSARCAPPVSTSPRWRRCTRRRPRRRARGRPGSARGARGRRRPPSRGTEERRSARLVGSRARRASRATERPRAARATNAETNGRETGNVGNERGDRTARVEANSAASERGVGGRRRRRRRRDGCGG